MYHLSKLKNGITLITVPIQGTKATTVMALFPVGSRYESKKLSGASHFVEHLMFKGTEKRPTALDISRELDAVGAEYNAFTYKDYTGYYVKIDAEKMGLAFDLLSDMIFNSRLEKSEIEKERGVIVEELRMYEDNPTMDIDQLFDHIMFGDHPLGWDIGGTSETVRAVSREELFNYYKTHYVPNAMVLVVAGNIKSNKLKQGIKYFENVQKKGKSYAKNFEKSLGKTSNSLEDRIAVKEKKVDQAHVIIGYPGLNHTDKRRYAEAVLLTILGGGMSSRLFVEVREKRGLAYMVRAGSTSHRDAGTVYIQAGLDPARLGEAFKVIGQELEKIIAHGITKTELNEAKEQIVGHMALSFEDSSVQADWYAKHFLFSKVETFDQSAAKIKKVTAAEVLKLAKQLFVKDQMRVAVIGPVSKETVVKIVED